MDAFLAAHPSAKIFLATDQRQYVDQVKERYPQQLFSYDAIRSENKTNVFQVNDGRNYKKGEDALIDCLLLSRCRYLLKSTSHLSETAVYFNPSMEVKDLNYLH